MTEKVLVGAPTRVIGIDVGQSGAVVVIGRGKADCRRDFKNLRDIAKAVKELSEGVDFVVIEGVAARPSQGVCSVFSFGRSTGVAFGALCVALPEACPIYEAWPQRWQNYWRQYVGMEKDETFDSCLILPKILPGISRSWITRKCDHGTGDAALIALYGISILQQPGGRALLDSLLSPKVVDLKSGSRVFVARGKKGQGLSLGVCNTPKS